MWGGVTDKTIYGKSASSLGNPDYTSGVIVSLPDSTTETPSLYGEYVAPYDCFIVLYSHNTLAGSTNCYLGLSIGLSFTNLIRREKGNGAVSVCALKGNRVGYSVMGTGNTFYVYKLIPN